MKSRHAILATALFALALLAGGQAFARDTGDWLVRVGVSGVMPKSNNLSLGSPIGDLNVDDGYMLSFNGTYMYSPNWGVEILAALPFKHDIGTSLAGDIGETKHLPPTVSLQYHVPFGDSNYVYFGGGLNYTIFFSEKTEGAIAGTNLELDGSFGLALQLGADVMVGDNLFVNFDLRWIDIESEAKLDGAVLGDVEIDPMVLSVNFGKKF